MDVGTHLATNSRKQYLLHINRLYHCTARYIKFALFVYLVPRDCCVALPNDATGLSAVCECGVSCSYSLTVFIFDWLPDKRISSCKCVDMSVDSIG